MATPASKLESANAQGQTDRSLLLTHKTELIGELAQAMANQFNNIMMAVTGYAELELKKATAKDRRALEQIITNANRATSLIQKLLDFSRKQPSSPQALELNAVISEVSGLAKELLAEQAELLLSPDNDNNSQTIYADRSDVEQVFLTLIVIARDSLSGTGQITVSTCGVDPSQAPNAPGDRGKAGQYILLSVEANGAAAKSTDPEENKKIASSLEVVRTIVTGMDGLARFSNESGSSSYELYFPAAEPEAERSSSTLPRNLPVARTILVVEDDDSVRLPSAEFLMMEGFKVLQARTGAEALNVVQQSRSSPDILITDIFMPKMNGREVAAKLLEEHPHLKVLYMSGDPHRSDSSGAKRIPQDSILRKPFRLNVLRDKIHDLLGE
jgi:two-component system, cell cycle sensor histidine kinase and response regulator CckA